MIRNRYQGLTLIELLIVIAIISIMAAGSLAIITEPMKEHVRANIRMEQEAGFSTLAAQIVADAHDSDKAKVGTESIEFPGIARYYVDGARVLRRSVGDDTAGAALLPHVREFTMDRSSEDGLQQIHVVSSIVIAEREVRLDRRIPLRVGNDWIGGVK
ncbi:prepilin-type N-terminal cleavage/methylation domain-containing protein [bacterium]|nr:prepilin-type N-terminal cleavage/methylation domain-containing protein [bacterium]